MYRPTLLRSVVFFTFLSFLYSITCFGSHVHYMSILSTDHPDCNSAVFVHEITLMLIFYLKSISWDLMHNNVVPLDFCLNCEASCSAI